MKFTEVIYEDSNCELQAFARVFKSNETSKIAQLYNLSRDILGPYDDEV